MGAGFRKVFVVIRASRIGPAFAGDSRAGQRRCAEAKGEFGAVFARRITVRFTLGKLIETPGEAARSTSCRHGSRVSICRRIAMSGTKDKAKGLANEAIGNVKQGVGKVTDNDKLRAEGKAQELKGEGQQIKGNVKDAVDKP
jgi:uncharacterized protein YjbJ (UPF0337 family)